MRDFNNYSSNQNQDAMDMLGSFAKKYEGASQGELISAIMSEAEKGRRNGTLTNADIERFAKMLAPMLNGEQRKQLDMIVKKLTER
ncbi:MAG: hypothetical protein IKL82_01265 [Clostridia bacterium]|nr:hypothetical protein [Clostridia bacterium]